MTVNKDMVQWIESFVLENMNTGNFFSIGTIRTKTKKHHYAIKFALDGLVEKKKLEKQKQENGGFLYKVITNYG